jgi:hypothetical protein
MMHRKTQIAAAVGAALFVTGTAAFAQAGPTVQAYGQISRALMHADDGVQNKWFHVDNEASGTRFGLTGNAPAPFGSGNRVGFRIELDLQSNESQLVNFTPGTGPVSNFPGTASGAGFNERHMDAWFEGGWGRFNIGQGDGAANGASESDLSGTGMANGIGVADVGGGFQYRTSTGGYSGTTIGASINQQDFESRYDRLLYTTPSFNGFRATASWGQSGNADVYEVGGWFNGKLGGMGELAAAIGYSNQGNGNTAGGTHDVVMGGSVSWLLPMGLSLTGVWTERDQPTTGAGIGGPVRTSTFQYLKVGFKTGPHAFAVDYGTGEDFAAAGDEATVMGVGYVWNPIRWLEILAAYKQHELDRTGASLNKIKIGTVGTRVRF